MKKQQKRIAATELRVNLGAALRDLDTTDLIIEKGGVPVALLRRYESGAVAERGPAMMDTTYDRALAWRADDAAWDRAMSLAGKGWLGEDEALTAEAIRAARDAGASERYFELDAPDEEGSDAGEIPARQRRLHQSSVPSSRVADEPPQRYSARRPRD